MREELVAPGGLTGVVAFSTRIAEADTGGGQLRYRGVAIDDLVGVARFEDVWALLVCDDVSEPLGEDVVLPDVAASGNIRADVQAGLAQLAGTWGAPQLLDLTDAEVVAQLRATSMAVLDLTAQAARAAHGPSLSGDPSPADSCEYPSLAHRFLAQWHGDADPDHARALDAYWQAAAEHGISASTFTARVVASTGADVPTCVSSAMGAMSGPLHGGAPARALHLLTEVEQTGDAAGCVARRLDAGRRVMGFGHPIYRTEDPRARLLRKVLQDIGAPRFEAAAALEQAVLVALAERKPGRVLATNMEYWAAVLLDYLAVPPFLFTPLFTCARAAGWAAHIREQAALGKMIRPTARYVGAPARTLADVLGWGGFPVR